MDVKLGSKVKDKITGFEGVAVARCVYLNGCVQFEVEPLQLKDGVPQKSYWLDEQRVVLKSKKEKKDHNLRPSRSRLDTGGPQSHAPKQHPPSLAGYEE